MRQKIFRWLRGLSLGWFGHSPATAQKQVELQRIEARRTYLFDQIVKILDLALPKSRAAARTIVEVGIGTGGFAKRLRQSLPQALIIGVDPEVLGGNPSADALTQANGLALPFNNQGVDVVISSLVLHILVEPSGLRKVRTLIGEAQRVGQTIIFMDILGSLWTVFFATIGAVLLERVSFKFMVHTFRVMLSCLTRGEYEELAKEFGLQLLIWAPNPFYPKVAILYSPPEIKKGRE